MIKNALYQIQRQLFDQGDYQLIITMTDIFLIYSHSESAPQGTLSTESSSGKLANYYLDWNNYHKTGLEDVQQLLNQFWQRHLQSDELSEQLQLFNLKTPFTAAQLKTSYRSLVQTHHPDRGGDHELFLKIQQGYDLLQQKAILTK